MQYDGFFFSTTKTLNKMRLVLLREYLIVRQDIYDWLLLSVSRKM